MSIIKNVTLQKIVARDFRDDPRTTQLTIVLVFGYQVQRFIDSLRDSVCKITAYRGRESKSLRIHILALDGSGLHAAAFYSTEEPSNSALVIR